MLPIGMMVYMFSNGREGPFLPLPGDRLPEKTPNAYQQELEQQIKGKLDEQLFTVTLRLMTAVESRSENRQIARGFLSAMASYGNAGYQSLIRSRLLRFSVVQWVAYWLFERRLPSFFGSSILSTSEVSGIYHFPYTSTTKTENIAKLHYRLLPAPLSLKQKAALDIYFAKNTYGGSVTRIGLSEEERRRHVYILGATGTGKSTLLLSMIGQDITNGKGLCVIDPHGDLVEKILPCIPDKRIKDVIYFNPDDIGYPIGINLLELASTGNEEEKTREKEFITESIISLFHKLYPDRYSGPRMEYILRNTVHTAFTTPHPTLFTIYKLLTNTPFRRSVTATLEDENLRDFWKYEFAKAGEYQKVKMISPITNKIGRFLFSASAKRILEQETSSINFDDIMDSGKILICNLSKGRIGEDSSEVFGILIMTKIQLAALKRARSPIEKRRDFYLYVDEFQNFATPAFAQILSEARKYRLGAILAHQTTSQLTDKSLVNVTLANTGTVICFRTANPEDEKLILPQFYPYISQGEIASLPSFHFYMKVSAITPEEPFSGETILMSEPANNRRVNKVISESRNRYAVNYTKKEVLRTPSSKPHVNAAETTNTNPEDRQTYQRMVQ
jgi:energy-coupling factor transporter ATP-binding protein EcfA2